MGKKKMSKRTGEKHVEGLVKSMNEAIKTGRRTGYLEALKDVIDAAAEMETGTGEYGWGYSEAIKDVVDAIGKLEKKIKT